MFVFCQRTRPTPDGCCRLWTWSKKYFDEPRIACHRVPGCSSGVLSIVVFVIIVESGIDASIRDASVSYEIWKRDRDHVVFQCHREPEVFISCFADTKGCYHIMGGYHQGSWGQYPEERSGSIGRKFSFHKPWSTRSDTAGPKIDCVTNVLLGCSTLQRISKIL